MIRDPTVLTASATPHQATMLIVLPTAICATVSAPGISTSTGAWKNTHAA